MNARTQATMAAVAMASLASVASLHTHHSASMFDLAASVWVKGTFVRLDRINPHTLMTIEERMANGTVQRWTVEGPSLQGLTRMDVPQDFLEAGDAVENCVRPADRLERWLTFLNGDARARSVWCSARTLGRLPPAPSMALAKEIYRGMAEPC